MTECHNGNQKKMATLTFLTALVTALLLYDTRDATVQERSITSEDIVSVPWQFMCGEP